MTPHTKSPRRIWPFIAASLAVFALASCEDKSADLSAKTDAPERAAEADARSPESKPAGAKKDPHAGMEHAMHHNKAPAPSTIPEDQSGAGMTKQGKFYVSFAPTANPIPFQELFGLKISVFGPDKKTPAKDVKLDQVRAVMPAHNHGMNVEPEMQASGEGAFEVSGMRFHMQGEGDDGKWVLELVLRDGEQIDTFSHELQCCR
ncbi:MAG: hypothetical protein AAGI01_02295 [Myxococcota bacterium]